MLERNGQAKFVTDTELFGDGQEPLNAALEAEFLAGNFFFACRNVGVQENGEVGIECVFCTHAKVLESVTFFCFVIRIGKKLVAETGEAQF